MWKHWVMSRRSKFAAFPDWFPKNRKRARMAGDICWNRRRLYCTMALLGLSGGCRAAAVRHVVDGSGGEPGTASPSRSPHSRTFTVSEANCLKCHNAKKHKATSTSPLHGRQSIFAGGNWRKAIEQSRPATCRRTRKASRASKGPTAAVDEQRSTPTCRPSLRDPGRDRPPAQPAEYENTITTWSVYVRRRGGGRDAETRR